LLLKMHGCVNNPDDIVLTREDYLRYADRRAALSGIVQAMLITRHMLFVGFSLTDGNFLRIVDDVRKAIRGTSESQDGASPFGTALLLEQDHLLSELWRGDLDCVSISDREAGSFDDAARKDAARQIEILLDHLLAESTLSTPPLLDPTYGGALTDEELQIRKLLQVLEGGATDEIRRAPAWRPIAKLLEEFRGRRATPPGKRELSTVSRHRRHPSERN
jgi:hypothetical protein